MDLPGLDHSSESVTNQGANLKRSENPGPSCESVKSTDSKELDFNFKSSSKNSSSSSVSLQSNRSKKWGENVKRSENPGPSCESVKSSNSKDLDFVFKRDLDPGPSCESVQSDWSKDADMHLCREETKQKHARKEGSQSSLDAIFMCLEEKILSFVKVQLKRFHRVLASDYSECLVDEEDEEQSREAFLKIMLDFLRRMDQEPLAERLQSMTTEAVCHELKNHLQQKFRCVYEGIAKAGNSTHLNQIYTDLYITEGGAAGVNQEHEVRHIENASRKPAAPDIIITCEAIFKGPTHKPELTEGPIRTVLTKGVAGIGKTVLTQKFSLDWAEGKANQDIQLLFPFTFRELNVLRNRQFSLVGLLHHFFRESAGLYNFQHLQVVFIFDGLDECRLPLDFTQTQALTEATESVSVDVLLVNLIRGTLLPSARIWITTRSAAASQIPVWCVSMLTEVRGFTDPQKEQYFRKRFRDQQQATDIISHIKTSRSLYIMCHIPVFCWIISTVLDHLMKTGARDKLPQSLTQMYIHFLVVQAKAKSLKYDGHYEMDPHWTPETRKMVESLGKLAFEQLQKRNLIFYKSDLCQCGLNPKEASVYSGVFTQVFIEEPGLYQDKVYCFIHLSIQEFLAALHVHLTFVNSGVNLLSTQQTSESLQSDAHFYQSAVDQALQSSNGHLDLFLRFLLGLSLPTNQNLLRGLLTQTGTELTNQETVEYIRKKLNEGLSTESKMNLFHCLNELNNRSLVEQIQEYIRGQNYNTPVSPAEWSALAFILLSSNTDLEEFDLRKYYPSEKGLLNLLPVVKACSKATLRGCNLSQSSCSLLSSVLSSSNLTHLDLSNNQLQDLGVELLCSGLKFAPCKLETLRLSCCNLSQSSCGPLSLVLNSSSFKHLDLSNNDLQDSGVELLCSGLKNAPCRLETIRLSGCLVSEEGGASLASALSFAHSQLRELDLSYNHPGPAAELLTALREDPHSPLHTLRLEPAGEQWMTPGPAKYSCELSLYPNTAHRKLKLSDDNRTVTGVEEEQQYPHHQDRFRDKPQVQCSTGLTGRCYWEVDWSGWEVDIAVSYRRMKQTGNSDICWFGDNDHSWSLRIRHGNYFVSHNKRETPVFTSPFSSSFSRSGRVCVFLDSEAGSLSLYKIRSDGGLFHLYTFTSTFTEPLFPGFALWPGSSVSLVNFAIQHPSVDKSNP